LRSDQQYDEIRRQMKGLPEQDRTKVNIWEKPFKTEDRLRNAILAWESRNRDIMELHFFWWIGFICVIIESSALFGQSLVRGRAPATGFVEMIFWTTPTLRFFGALRSSSACCFGS